MKQRILLVVFTFMSGCSVLWAQKFEKVNNEGVKIKYEVISAINRTVQVTGGERPSELIVPAIVENNGIEYRVTSIKKQAYMPLTKFVHRIRHLVLPEGLVDIGQRAFCCALMSDGNESIIYIPSTVKLIGKEAFADFTNGTMCVNRGCLLECLPSFVDTTKCETYGLSKESVTNYWATHTPKGEIIHIPVNIAQNVQPQVNHAQAPVLQAAPVAKQPKVLSSDVDVDIPKGTGGNKNTFAIIVANEDYQGETNVDYAKNDGETFKTYCHKTLGLPEKNVHFVANATLNNIIGELDWLKQVCDAFGGEASVIFYYAGHGIPDEASGSAYLLPTDGNSRILRTCFSINELYETLGKMPAKQVTVLMDACFSGAKRDGNMLASARGVAIKAKANAPKGNMIVLSAAQGDETAYKYEDAKHGLFTYFLLKKLKETKGNVTMGELSQYIQDQVKRYSIVENGKSQTPSTMASQDLGDSWKNMKLR